MIELRNVGKIFTTANGNIEALKEINLTIEKGEIFGIIGLSGAGKSTLVRCINFLEIPTSGDVIFNGQSLKDLSKKELLKVRQSMGMIFQGFNLLSQRNSVHNICYPLEIAGVPKAEAKKRALELLELVGLQDRAKSFPAQLSGGQKQRVAIARALATNPEVLLCDEATSALDPNTTQSILSLLKDINEKLGVTIVVITHEMRVVEQICNKVAVIDSSRIVECGEVKDVFTNPQSDIARELILPKATRVEHMENHRLLRVVFDGESSCEPIIANMVLECHTPVNILFADTKDIEDRIYGQMVLGLPQDEMAAQRVEHYLKSRNIVYKEEQTL